MREEDHTIRWHIILILLFLTVMLWWMVYLNRTLDCRSQQAIPPIDLRERMF